MLCFFTHGLLHPQKYKVSGRMNRWDTGRDVFGIFFSFSRLEPKDLALSLVPLMPVPHKCATVFESFKWSYVWSPTSRTQSPTLNAKAMGIIYSFGGLTDLTDSIPWQVIPKSKNGTGHQGLVGLGDDGPNVIDQFGILKDVKHSRMFICHMPMWGNKWDFTTKQAFSSGNKSADCVFAQT